MLHAAKPVTVPVPLSEPVAVRVVSGGTNVRSGVDMDSGIIGEVSSGSVVRISDMTFVRSAVLPSCCLPRLKLADRPG
jgi:hypothetical protein